MGERTPHKVAIAKNIVRHQENIAAKLAPRMIGNRGRACNVESKEKPNALMGILGFCVVVLVFLLGPIVVLGGVFFILVLLMVSVFIFIFKRLPLVHLKNH